MAAVRILEANSYAANAVELAQRTPLGYARGRHRIHDHLALHAGVVVCTVVFTFDAFVFTWPNTFSPADVNTHTNLRLALTGLGTLVGLSVGHAGRRFTYGYLADGLLLLSLFVASTPWIYWSGFDGGFMFDQLQLILPSLGACATAATTSSWVSLMGQDLRWRHLVADAVTLSNLAIYSVYSMILASLVPLMGLLGAGHCLAFALFALSVTATSRHLRMCDSHLWPSVRYALLTLTLLVQSGGLYWSMRIAPLRVVRAANQTVVHYELGRIQTLKQTSSQDGFHVFVDNRLRFSTLDQQRWAHALTRPALARLQCPRRALVFSQGEGLIERELLLDACLASIHSIVRDRLVLNAAQRQRWWSSLIGDAWRSPRVTIQEMDPARWLLVTDPQPYDLIIVDLPDPDDFVNAKYYTRFFYRQLQRRLQSGGIVVVQATSSLRSPRTFASIRATLEAAGFVTLPYRAALVTLGEWTFLLAQTNLITNVRRPNWLDGVAVAAREAFALSPDAVPKVAGQVSRLDDPVVLESFLSEGTDNAP